MSKQTFVQLPFEFDSNTGATIRVDHAYPNGWSGSIITPNGLTSGEFSWGVQVETNVTLEFNDETGVMQIADLD